LRRVDEATGLSPAKLSALSVIVYAGPVTLGDLAAAEQVRPPTMTRLVQELEAAGLIERQADDNDRRITRIRPTPAGKRLLKHGQSRRVALLTDWMRTLTEDEFGALADAVSILEHFTRPK
jgi:DNA-binding MarR family transcriptional regulator